MKTSACRSPASESMCVISRLSGVLGVLSSGVSAAEADGAGVRSGQVGSSAGRWGPVAQFPAPLKDLA
ncbi:hypothetical protein [Streptomyces sp. NPDC058867]|uniref:hypothetical protein n=1 Tax=unclassified Streptomyces TaxID=2593676 RepID=UPI0036887F34